MWQRRVFQQVELFSLGNDVTSRMPYHFPMASRGCHPLGAISLHGREPAAHEAATP